MNERHRNIAVGLTTIAGLVGFALLLLLFGAVPRWFESGYEVRIELPDAGGLHSGSRVYLNGVQIGMVRSVALLEPVNKGVIVTVGIERRYRIPAHVEVKVPLVMLGGSPTIQFYAANDVPEQVAYLPTDGSAMLQGRVASPFEAVVGDVSGSLTGPVAAAISALAINVEELSSEWLLVGQNLNQLLELRSVKDVDMGEVGANLSTVVVRLDERMAETREVLAGIDRIVNDEQMVDDLRTTFANASGLTEKLADSVNELSGTVQEGVETLRTRYLALADDLGGAVASLHRFVNLVGDGEGSVGQLIHNPALYDNLNDAAVRLQKALDELRLLVQKWKAEGLSVQF